MSEVVKVSVVADTSSAKQQLQDLQTQLSNLSAQSININDASLVQANKRVIELQQNLQKAMNPNTGKLDLSRFSAELSKSGTQLKDYATALQNLGPQGSQAFLSLSSAIASAEAPTTRLNAKLLKFGQTIKNTINWQISSSIIHGVMGQFQSAISYAEKLNTSLNNIRIVTGVSTDKMAEFAKQANQAAQKLSTTTTAYTNASLIYYQQGLGDKEVAARTETTLKLANVSRQSVEEVSNQMTAIWNNYAEGASNLEHYADVITALGAATASSSSEIATGLEKFAAIGKTVGLSYDYATTALATITAKTRQSADTVGTGLRTLFSRLQGLKLGETLEDGVSLNKYSAALQTVGVNIQDQYGKVKDMDQILDELGAKWNTISKEQQIALAQTVGGVRQYTNLIALMDNWGTFQKNLKVAQGADGTLDKQAQIYEESWEAASKRVRAATESIYSSLLDDKAIVKIIDGFAKFLDVIKGITEGLGGMKGIILTISALVTQSMAKNMPTYLKDIGFGFKALFSNKDLNKIQSDNLDIIKQRMANQSISEAERAQLNKVYNQQYMNQSLLAHQGRMSKEDIAAYQTRMMLQGMADDARIAEITQQEQARQAAREQMRAMAGIYKTPTITREDRDKYTASIRQAEARADNAKQIQAVYQSRQSEIGQLKADVSKFQENFSNKKMSMDEAKAQVPGLEARIQQLLGPNAPSLAKLFDGHPGSQKERIDALGSASSSWMTDFADAVRNATANLGSMSEVTQEVENANKDLAAKKAQGPEAIARERALDTAATLHAQGKAGDQWNSMNDSAKLAEIEKSRASLQQGMFATGTVYGSNLNAAKRQAEVMAKPMQQTAAQIGEVYGARKAIADLRAQAEPEAQKDFAKMSKTDQQAFSQQYANRIKQISSTLEKAGGAEAKTSFLRALFGDSFDPTKLDEELEKIDVNSIASALKTKRDDIEKILSGEDGEGTEGEETGGVLGKLRALLTGQEKQYAQATGRTSQEDADRIGEANRNIIDTAETGYNRNQATPQSQLPLAKDTATLSTALTSTASGLMMFNNVINSVSSAMATAFDETADGITQFGAGLGAVSTALMASGMIQNGANSIAGLFKAGSSAPGWIGLAISAAGAIFGVIKGINEQDKKEKREAAEKKIQRGEESAQYISQVQELNKAQENLINAYNQAAKDLENSTGSLEELENARQALIESIKTSTEQGYSNENAMGYALAGDTKSTQRILDENRLRELNVKAQDQQTRLSGAEYLLTTSTSSAGLNKTNSSSAGNIYYLKSGSSIDYSDEQKALEVLRKYNSKYFTVSGSAVKMNAPINSKNASEIYDYYKTLTEVYESMQDAGVTEDSEYFKNIKKQIDAYQEAATKYEEAKGTIQDYSIERLGLGGTVNSFQIGKASDQITDLQTYENYRNLLIKTAIEANSEAFQGLEKGSEEWKEKEEEITKAVDAYLGTNPAVMYNEKGNLQYASQGLTSIIEHQKDFYPNMTEEEETVFRQNLVSLYDEYGDALFQIGTKYKLPIHIDKEQFEDEYKAAIDLLKVESENKKIQLQIEAITNFKDQVTSATADPKVLQSFVKQIDKKFWKSVFGEEFDLDKFMALTEAERNELLDKYITKLQSREMERLPAKIEALNAQVEQDKAAREEALEARDQTENAIGVGIFGSPSLPFTNSPKYDQSVIDQFIGIGASHSNVVTSLYNKLYDENGEIRQENLYPVPNGAHGLRYNFSDSFLNGLTDSENAFLKNLITNPTTGLPYTEDEFPNINYPDLIKGLYQYNQANKNFQAAAEVYSNDKSELKETQEEWDIYQALGWRPRLAKEAYDNGIDYDAVQEYATALRETTTWQQEFVKNQDNIAEASERAALSILETQNAISALNGKYIEWDTILNQNNVTQAQQEAAYKEMAKHLTKLINPTQNISSKFAKWAHNMGLVYSASQGDKEAILQLGKAWAAASVLGEDGFKAATEGIEDTEEAVTAATNAATDVLQDYYGNYTDETGEAIKATDDLATVTNWLKTAEEGQAMGEAEMAAARRLYAAEYKRQYQEARDAGLSVAEANETALNGATEFMDNLGADMPQPTVKTIPAGETAEVSRTDIDVVAGSEGDLEYSEGETTTVTNSSEQEISYIDWNGTGSGSAQTPVNPLPPKGGGGGGGGKKKKDHKKPDTGTRYHKIKAKQANNDQNKQEVSRKKERAFGAEKIKQAEEEIKLQKEAIELQRQYVDEINDYLAEDRVKMIEAFTPDKLGFDLGFNLEIDENGVITNYRQLEEKLLEEENKLIDKYNEGGLDDEAYQEAQKKIDDAREYLKVYEETRDLYEEQWIKLREYLDELADSALELTKLKIDLDISISDDTLGLLDYMLEKIEDNAYKAAEAISLLGDKTNETLKRVDIYQSGLEEILNSKGLSLDDLANITDEQLINGDFTQAQIDQIREWRDALLEANKELLQMREDIINKIIDAFNELNDKVQESYDQFDNYNSIIENYTNITDLLGIRLNQQQKELIKMLGQAALNNAQTQAAAARTIYEEALANQQAAQKAYEQAVANGDTEAMRQWEKVVKETQTVLDDAQQQWLEAWQAALEKAQELYTKAIEDTVKAFEESVSGAFGTLDYLQSAFDRMGQTNDQYLQDFEKLYELNKLNRDIQNAIDDTTNIRDKQALRDLQKEINRLQEEGIELSQYDVDALRKKFELEQARLALEDARNAKSEVRLQRDANGNWGYVYTAKEDEVAKAEQEYEDKLYEYQKLNDEYITELQSRVLETQTTYKEALAEIYNDTTLTDAQREARINELNNWLQAELSYFEQQLNNAMDNQQGTLDLYYNKYNNAQAKLADSWDETTLRMLTGANSVAEYMDNVKKSVEDMLQSSSEALSQYNKDVDETNHMAGVETEDYEKEVSDAITTIGKDSAKTREEVAKLSEELKDNFVDSLKEAINWEEEYANKINAAVEANENFIKSINEMIAKLAELESSNPGLEKARTAYQTAELAHEEYVKEWKKQHPDEDVVEADIVDEAWEKAKAEWQKYLEEVVGISPIYDTGVPQSLKTGGYTGRWNIASAKTGMYTGSWAGADVEENGRLAFLHQKELVLNADDTQNFLDATQILRTIDLSTNMFSKGLGNIITPWIGDMRQQDLEQNVHIEASFPNVTEHNEIERAFDNLINRAAQYVNRK